MSSLPEESSVLHDGGPGSVDEAAGEQEVAQNEIGGADVSQVTELDDRGDDVGDAGESQHDSRVLEYLQDAREDTTENTPGPFFQGYRKIQHDKNDTEDLPENSGQIASPAVQPSEDGLSAQESVTSSPPNSAYASRLSPFQSPSPSLRPFDRRFQSRLHPGQASPLPASPTFFNYHTRNSSITSQIEDLNGNSEDANAPWDAVRWTKLKKITSQIYSETGRRNFGSPTCISVSANIVLGTSKGIILVFDYHQNLKSIIGPGTKALECGSITALAVSADNTTIAGGHSQGNIFTWELAKPARPFLSIPPVATSLLEARKVDGHVEGVSVLHLGFLGIRHTALVSADGKGMAFSHLATRGFGSIGRIVKTTRILGRYPFDIPASGRPRKPSSVLAFSPLPLGNSIQSTDSMGLVAILTPFLLVVISTTPVAQTQHKASRPKEVASDQALSGSLAWFPAVKQKDNPLTPTTKPKSCRAKLAYTWSNVLTVLELNTIDPDPTEDQNRPPILQFRAKSRWECDEAIVAVQWISRQILGVLTATQRLIILEEPTLRPTEVFDLMPKQILHSKLFAYQLMPLVGTMDEEASSHRGIADAFYNSFKTYKGRMFLLCRYEVYVGALSNWVDRLVAMMEIGDFIGAIRLATAYYVGEADKLTVGLPEEAQLRHPLVEEKLLEMMAASLRYAFGKASVAPRAEILGKDQLHELATVCFVSCLCMNNVDFLFDEVYEHYENGNQDGIFLELLEPYILEGRVTSVPPAVVKRLITHFTAMEQEARLEEMLCHMDTQNLDIDQVTSLCKKHNLYDALIYVWNRALGDYITPMVDLLTLLRPIYQPMGFQNVESHDAVNALKIFPYLSYTLTSRVYPTGESLPEAEAIAAKAAIYYFLFLGRTIVWPRQGGTPFLTKPNASEESSFPYLRLILHYDAPSFLSALNEAFEDPFLNGPADQTINDGEKREVSEEQMFARSVNRQYIITILLEVMNSKDFPPQDTIYLNMFIARNLPKFPQFILLSGTALNSVLVGLCNYPGSDIADDCQLSVEYLLSVYRLPDVDEMVELFMKAKFYRVLKTIFRAEKQYAKLLQAYLSDDGEPDAVFSCIEECLHVGSGISNKQSEEFLKVVADNSRRLIDINTTLSARYINAYAPALHEQMLESIDDREEDQFVYLRTILEPSLSEHRGEGEEGKKTETAADMKRPEIMNSSPSLVELYVRLMCRFDPRNVPDFVGNLQSGDLRLEEVLPAMEESSVVDATVRLMAREGLVAEAMERLIRHLKSLEAGLLGILQAQLDSSSVQYEDENGVDTGLRDLLDSLKKYTQVGIWLCQGQKLVRDSGKGKGVTAGVKGKAKGKQREPTLSKEELLWLDFIDTIVQIAKSCTSTAAPGFGPSNNIGDGSSAMSIRTINTTGGGGTDSKTGDVLLSLRKLVQDAFTALLMATTTATTASTTGPLSPKIDLPSVSSQTSFLHILRAFLSRASLSHPSLSDLRSVLAGIFDAYTYEHQLLHLANKLLEKDRFVGVDEVVKLRRGGWRPMSQACEACGRRAWGPGAAGGIYAAWERRREEERRSMNLSKVNEVGLRKEEHGGKGKQPAKMTYAAAAAAATAASSSSSPSAGPGQQVVKSPAGKQESGDKPTGGAAGAGELVVFVCRHVYHLACLEKLQGNPNPALATTGGAPQHHQFRCLACEKSEEGV